ncbi:hypothetical protein K9D52_000782 [Salmonella enterica]|nr:hypothetical protein [Salmonella enterica]EIB6303405.1 hypothetical protein [Salmonella enterica]
MEIRSISVIRSAKELMEVIVLHQNSVSPIEYNRRLLDVSRKHKMKFIGFVGEWRGNMTFALMRCTDGHYFVKRLNDCFKTRFGCSKCGALRQASKVRKPEEMALQEARDVAEKAGHGEVVSHFEGGYKGCLVKNLVVLCPVHGKRLTTHTNFVKGGGCRKCCMHGYRPSSPGHVYVQRITGQMDAIKFGITNRDPRVRMKQHKRGSKLNHELVFHWLFEDGTKAFDIEAILKSKYKEQCQYVPKELMNDGYTETIPPTLMKDFLKDVKNLCNEARVIEPA